MVLNTMICCLVRYQQSADLWSFGIVLLELAGGRVPHAQASFTALVMSTVHDPAPRLEDYAKRKYSQARRSAHLKMLSSLTCWSTQSTVLAGQFLMQCM